MRAHEAFGRRGGRMLAAIAVPAGHGTATETPTYEVPEASRIPGPILTTTLLGAMIAVFWAEQNYPVSAGHGNTPSLRTITALGAFSRDLALAKGKWWRVFTAPFMHGSVSHIVGNGIAFFFAALNLERMVGRRWLSTLFFLGAIGGIAGSALVNPAQGVTVGASGAIMCLLAALFVLSFDSQVVKRPGRLRFWTLLLLLPSLAPAAAGEHIDVAAHAGGAIAGIILAYFIQITWSEEQDAPSFRQLAAIIGCGCAGLTLFSFYLVSTHYAVSSARAAALPELQLMSEEDMPDDPAEADKKSSEYVQKFPDDPRAHFFRAIYYTRGHDLTSAQGELRAALAEREVLEQLPPSFKAMVQIMLSATLARQGRLDDARATARDACEPAEDISQLYSVMRRLKEMEVCPW